MQLASAGKNKMQKLTALQDYAVLILGYVNHLAPI